ncbi:recombinase family protein [Streptomyces sp. NBC_01236]|uniref:recombinase family protein n=1 Tax=Streptomyces sp. NBC_01236 TaxID=2903789 RepID=UPI002E0D7509|nr:recombinase family protein [Streptomyces sp. NBC_01236]
MGTSLTAVAQPIAREYLRVSAKGDRSIPEQHDENVRAAAREGISLGTPYKDQGSASRYATKGRDDFDRLLDDLRNDQFGADLLWLWESSRGSRRVGEWVTLIELCEDRAVRIYVTTHGRMYDPSTPRDRRSLLEDAVDSEYEFSKISSRTLRGLDSNARDGKPHGICPFGYQRDYEIVGGKRQPVRQYAHPVEGPLIVSLFTRVRAGHPFNVIAQDWKDLGVVGRRGKPISATTMRDLALNVAYIGLRSVKGVNVEASWDRLVSDELFYEVQAVLSDPSRVKGRPGAAQYELTGAVTCGECSGPITVRYRDGRDGLAAYECKRGHFRIDKEEVDAVVIGSAKNPGVILQYLARPDVYQDVTADASGGEAAQVRDELARARAELKETEEAEPESMAEERRFARRAERLEDRIRGLEAKARDLAAPTALSALFEPGGDVAARWAAAPVSARRAIAGLLLTSELLGAVTIARAESTVPAVDRLNWCRE